RVTGHRRQKNAAKRVAKRVAVATLERLHHHLGVERRRALHVDNARFQESVALHAESLNRNPVKLQAKPWGKARPLLGVELDDEAFVDVLAEFGTVGRT